MYKFLDRIVKNGLNLKWLPVIIATVVILNRIICNICAGNVSTYKNLDRFYQSIFLTTKHIKNVNFQNKA